MRDTATPPPHPTEAITLDQILEAWARLEEARGKMNRAWSRHRATKSDDDMAQVLSARQELADAEAAYSNVLNAASPEVQAAYFAAPEKPRTTTRESSAE